MTAKKKSGIPFERAYRYQRKLVSRVGDIFLRAECCHMTSEKISERMREEVYESVEWRKTPEWVHAHVNGYYEAKRNELYRYHIGWVMWLDGELLTSKAIDALTLQENNAQRATPHTFPKEYKSPWSRIDSEKSRHVWIDREGNLLLNRPFDEKWVENNNPLPWKETTFTCV